HFDLRLISTLHQNLLKGVMSQPRYRVRLLVSFSVDDFEVNDASNAYHTDWNAKPRACIGSIANDHENTKDGDEY
uniref:hypothetical protein n=1 Tax=Lacticaseibacillus suilingensis TaxID=2799577 RepID=UPI0022E2B13F